RRSREAFRRNMRVVFLWAGLVAVLNVAVYLVAGPAIIALLTGIPEVREAAEAWMLWPALLPLVGVWAYTYDGVYLAATRTRIMRNTVVVSFLVFLTVLFAAMPVFGNAGLWGAVAVFLGLRGVLLHLCLPRVLRAI
ncbi:MAG: MATE family efflux transporter, partial [Burkholderiales bacterium]|nr:MATE family efflux transporter [Burkholderiales bacterium]